MHNPDAVDLGFSAVCTSTMRNVWMAQNGISGSVESEKIFKEWVKKDNLKMTHNALDDARFQAKVFHCLQEELKK